MINGGSEASEGNFQREMTLRQWLGRPGRVVDRVESLHIFRQILEFVDLAHVQGVLLRNIRPSCFILSPFNRVAFIDSASTPSSSDRSSERSTGRASVQQLLRNGSPDDDAPFVDRFESISHRRQVLENVDDGDPRPNWSSSQDRAHGHGSDNGYGQDRATLAFLRESSRTDEFRSGSGGNDVILQSWGGSNSARWVQECSGSSGSELSGDIRARIVAGVNSAQTLASGGRSSEGFEDAGRGSGTEESPGEEEGPPRDERFPQRQALLMEQTWYASPEELLGGTRLFASDIYSLGVMFFELFCTFGSEAERIRVMSDLRHRILPPRLLSECPKEAAFCLWLLHPEPSSRPKAREVLQCELLSEAGEALAERQAAVSVEEKAAESDLLLDFLLRMQHQKQEAVCKLSLDVSRLTSDIEEVERRRSVLKQRGIPLRIPESGDRFRIAGIKEDAYTRNSLYSKGRWAIGLGDQEERKPPILGKRSRDDDGNATLEFKGEGGRSLDVPSKRSGDISSKSAKVMSNFSQLERVYFSMRWKVGPPSLDSGGVSSPNGSHTGGSSSTGDLGCNLKVTDQESVPVRGNSDDWLGCFFDSLCKYARYSRFEVKATLRHGDLLNTANMVCSLSFDRDEEYFATAGVCKRIKVFECDSLLNENVDIHYPRVEMTSRSKLSSICWNSYIKSHIASSDYEGVVQLWDVNASKPLMEYQEHEKRAWSVDFSRADPTKLASGSDDCCVKLWSINTDSSIATIKTRANVCCVQFPPDASHLLVFGSADYKIYCYDLRNAKAPLCVLASHSKAVSYVKFVDSGTLVSASTDNTLKLWDLQKASSCHGVDSSCSLTYTGHTNEKNFVGLSVADGYIACGSEKNAVFAYHKSLPMPMASHKFGCADPITGQETEDDGGQFVSSVCWRGKSQTLVAANSMGNIKVLEMV
ncbi:protein SPA1-related 3/4 [Marchantia polymorpha subsp. ruderalis]|uniref:Protein kinase domain-containing protein n=3 Tax=Marchantia polymorpha TaxID=3197 RepID=A0AAF6B4P1_MARPO|nr:hypothetical protein MARPO_0100s0059 [Marchantia polymorpha]BBN06975.1 hypothetical protein Mp_3g25460 [Marchantia polymorpha subsp. ruderalis]PTQ32354.1 hypothetical protein MARPO_0100s0059 [Marchantia polymorpha]PTQ32355.1 hypothetical protein MARPO_0100s0059 [Marchantia polymorpha]BBN06976.1 hypothetical protein Mp_3g25460 [Marchantia polymorpha subsp. ruderalis]|eukprot:PTQ32353.1 hypothetical protein MARPO_0100s0059 [Marchantia polymorpha]